MGELMAALMMRCALPGCEDPIEQGQALLSVLKLGAHGQLVNAPVHFDCFAEALAERIAVHLESEGDSVGDIAARIVDRLSRR